MRKRYREISLMLFVTLAVLLLADSPAAAALTGFVAKDNQGDYYEYCYEKLLDSYALKVIGEPNGLYEDYAAKEVYAFVDSKSGYIDYQDVLDRYASALALDEQFNLEEYLESDEAKRAEIPDAIQFVELSAGEIIRTGRTTSESNPDSILDDDFEPPKNQSPIIGSAGASKEQAQKWAEKREAHKRLIEIAPEYWDFGEKTGIRPEVLYVQAALVTDFGHYSNQLSADSNNWAGILKKDAEGNDPEDYEEFHGPQEGVKAHFNHMSAYVGLKPLGDPHDRYEVTAGQSWAGSVMYVEDLTGRWSSSDDYHLYILQLLNEIKDTQVASREETEREVPEEKDEKEDVGTKEGHVVVDVSEVTVLHLRSGPSTDHDILDRLVRGTVLEVTGNENEWLEVIAPEGKKGWVHGDYVREVDLKDNPFKDSKVAIDPGHGGADTGAIGVTGLKEKDFNLAVALLLAEFLEDVGAEVVMTRDDDYSVSNKERVGVANDAEVDVFVSIHANAYSNPDSNGIETYYCSNSGNSDAGKFLAQQLQRELISTIDFRDRGVKTNSYYVLKNTDMPSALVEVGFLSNPEEEKWLKTDNARAETAEALFLGLESYLRKYR